MFEKQTSHSNQNMVPPKAPTVLVLDRTEWDRLKRAAEPPQPPTVDKSDYLQKLNERSREWMKTWPDSIEGVVAKATKVRERKRQREREMVIKYKEIERLKTLIDYEVIERAKQQIFNNSCYGKQLISALLESKAIEEREAQIVFNKKRKEKELQLAKEQEMMNTLQVGLENEEKTCRRKEIDKHLAEAYKAIVEETKRKQTEEREKEILGELEDARLMKQLLDLEPHDMDHCKLKAIEAARSHVEDQKYYRKLKEIRDKEDDALVQVWKKYHDRVRCRQQKVMHEIHKAREDVPNLKLTYQLVEKLNDEEQKRYDEFVQKGVDKFDKRIIEEDQKYTLKQNKIKEQFIQYAKDNKCQAELLKGNCHANKCICERQTLVMKKKLVKRNVEINNETTQSITKPSRVVEESKESEKDLKLCKCNCKTECPRMKISFTDASTSVKCTKGTSHTSLKSFSMKMLKSDEMLSIPSSKQMSNSYKYVETKTPSIETPYLYKSIEATTPTNASKILSPSSVKCSSETSSSKYKTPSSLKYHEMRILDLPYLNGTFSSKYKTMDRHSEESKEGELQSKMCKCYCDSKSLEMKNLQENKTVTKLTANTEGVPSFLKPKNKLIEALKLREKEPTPWTGLKGAHDYFAKQAGGILKECRYKKLAQKVVNEYKKVNLLDTLPVSNWN